MVSRLSKIPLYLHGRNGRMGKEIIEVAKSMSLDIESGEPVKLTLFRQALVLDFSTPEGNEKLLERLKSSNDAANVSVLIGTTNIPNNVWLQWNDLVLEKKISRVLQAPNTSIGVWCLGKSLEKISFLWNKGYDIEIIETHHKYKVDAPSGTAMLLAQKLQMLLPEAKINCSRDGKREKGEIGIHAVRGGGVFGEHTIRFISEDDELSFSHRAFQRSLFAKGALEMGEWLLGQPPGFYHVSDCEF